MRYFIVFYSRLHTNNNVSNGSVSVMLSKYPNRNELQKKLNTDNSLASITNIIELTEQDYQEWIR